jgi:hypothetical protein
MMAPETHHGSQHSHGGTSAASSAAASRGGLWAEKVPRSRAVQLHPGFALRFACSGSSPKPTKHPALLALVVEVLGPELASVPEALVVPLGKAGETCVAHLCARGRLAPGRWLRAGPILPVQTVIELGSSAARQLFIPDKDPKGATARVACVHGAHTPGLPSARSRRRESVPGRIRAD